MQDNKNQKVKHIITYPLVNNHVAIPRRHMHNVTTTLLNLGSNNGAVGAVGAAGATGGAGAVGAVGIKLGHYGVPVLLPHLHRSACTCWVARLEPRWIELCVVPDKDGIEVFQSLRCHKVPDRHHLPSVSITLKEGKQEYNINMMSFTIKTIKRYIV